MRKGQAGLIIESVLLVVMLVLLGLFWGSFSNNTFLAGIFKVNDARLRHYCSSFLPVLLGDEYIKTTREGSVQAVSFLNELLGIEEPMLYPSATYLKNKIAELYGEEGKSLSLRSGFRVFNGTSTSREDVSIPIDLFALLGITASRGQLAACSFPLYGPEYSGYVNMSVVI